MPKAIFRIGDIVTIKSHPLAFQENGQIDAYVNQIPPFMCIKEIHLEKKKLLYSKEKQNKKIADNVKYLCTYFNQFRMIFEDRLVYQDMLILLNDITFHSDTEETEKGHTKLVDETNSYTIASYEFGKRVFFKTYKIEKRKKYKRAGQDSNSTTKTILTHTSPAFLLNGFKINNQQTIFDQKSGKTQRECSKELYKILWYNAYQEKFSEDFLPKEFFTDDSRIYGLKIPPPPSSQSPSIIAK